MAKLLVGLLIGVCTLGPAVAGTPLDPTGEDTGFVPTGRSALKCERFMNKRSALATFCTMLCHYNAVSKAFRGLPFDEEACEDTAPNSCRAKFEKALALIKPGLCPACMQTDQQLALYPVYRDIAESIAGATYCAPGTPIGSDDGGFVPTQLDTLTCEQGVAKNVSKLVKCIALRCHRNFADDRFQGTPLFNEPACEETDQPSSCMARFREQNALLSSCPPCLDQAHRDAIFDTIEHELDSKLGMVYCDSPSGAFLDE